MQWDLKAVVPTKKEPEIAVFFLHSSLTAQNWAINSGLTAPLTHLAPVIRTVIAFTVIIANFNAISEFGTITMKMISSARNNGRTNEDWFHKYSCRSSRASEIFLPASHDHYRDCGAPQEAGRRGPSLRVFSPLFTNDWRWFRGHLPQVDQHQRTRSDGLIGICDGSSTAATATATALGSTTTTTATTTNATTANADHVTVAFEAVLCRSPAGFRRVLITHCISALARGGGECLSNMWIVAWKISPKSTKVAYTKVMRSVEACAWQRQHQIRYTFIW